MADDDVGPTATAWCCEAAGASIRQSEPAFESQNQHERVRISIRQSESALDSQNQHFAVRISIRESDDGVCRAEALSNESRPRCF